MRLVFSWCLNILCLCRLLIHGHSIGFTGNGMVSFDRCGLILVITSPPFYGDRTQTLGVIRQRRSLSVRTETVSLGVYCLILLGSLGLIRLSSKRSCWVRRDP